MDAPKVSFADQGFQRPAQYTNQDDSPKIIRWITNYSGGFIKDEKQANYVIIAFIIVVMGVSIFLYISSRPNNSKPTPEALREIKEFERVYNSVEH